MSVCSRYEHAVAIEFFRLATKRSIASSNPNDRYVGMLNPIDGEDYCNYSRNICSSSIPSECETIIPFSNISMLADTPSRKKALKQAAHKF